MKTYIVGFESNWRHAYERGAFIVKAENEEDVKIKLLKNEHGKDYDDELEEAGSIENLWTGMNDEEENFYWIREVKETKEDVQWIEYESS